MTLQSVKLEQNTFCGPSVISAISGIGTDKAAAILSSITGKNKIKAVYISDVAYAFSRLGYKVEYVPFPKGTSVFSLMFSLRDGMYVFLIPGHFIAIEVDGNHRYICDNHTKNPISASASARLGAKILSVIKVTKAQ
jgi:hypothetical protein